MGESLEGFDASKVQPADRSPLPIDDYKAVIIAAARKPTKAGDGAYLNLTIEVVDGQYKGRKVFDILNLWNPSEEARQIAEGTLSSICRAIGVITPRSTDDLLNKPLAIRTKHEEWNGKVNAKVEKYAPLVDAHVRESAKDPDANPAPKWMGGAPADGSPPF